jgi:hypothetical protein
MILSRSVRLGLAHAALVIICASLVATGCGGRSARTAFLGPSYSLDPSLRTAARVRECIRSRNIPVRFVRVGGARFPELIVSGSESGSKMEAAVIVFASLSGAKDAEKKSTQREPVRFARRGRVVYQITGLSRFDANIDACVRAIVQAS